MTETRMECLRLAVDYIKIYGGDAVVLAQKYYDFVSGATTLKEYEASAGYPKNEGDSAKAIAN